MAIHPIPEKTVIENEDTGELVFSANDLIKELRMVTQTLSHHHPHKKLLLLSMAAISQLQQRLLHYEPPDNPVEETDDRRPH